MEIYTVDAFAARPFGGNPAAVCVCEQPMETALMQQIAKEMNLSETAFLTKVEEGYRLRWFTPAAEVKLCGHATLASAHILWETGRLGAGEVARFHTLSGVLTASKRSGFIELDFPARPSKQAEGEEAAFAQALRIGSDSISGIFRYGEDVLIELDSERTVRTLTPDFAALLGVPARGIAVTAKSDSDAYDIVSRFFAPRVGVNEDPVTGSAHCGLAPYWAERLGKNKLKAFQASARGGELELELAADRVKIGGKAVTVLRGKLDVSFLSSFA
ncbi:PhzF family phenazine biosynthesis protein [Paenibacillus caui]|uniref:PhzF family phenazine biosynthesis protein n=1 Tax=Paenibacillus caui TaxID=2873927 RepID=UPI001CA936B5|nr:PhzF family phenazine biosynthesis protein [Paenibacillus caui]